jgi:hypothetical protein
MRNTILVCPRFLSSRPDGRRQSARRNGAAVASKVQTVFIDDIDGSTAEGAVRFGPDGTKYEIDLNAEHVQQLRDALAAYVRAGRPIGGGSHRSARGEHRGSASGLNNHLTRSRSCRRSLRSLLDPAGRKSDRLVHG